MEPESKQSMIASFCGIDCGNYEKYEVSLETETAKRVVLRFKREGWLKENEGIGEIVERRMYSKGCRGNRSAHWTPDCQILGCCVDDKGHEFCYECNTFPCQRLTDGPD